MTKIIGLTALEILDSRGNPTVSAAVNLDSGHRGVAMVPSWLHCGFPRDGVWIPDGHPMDSQWLLFGFIIDYFRISYGTPLIASWISQGFPMYCQGIAP